MQKLNNIIILSMCLTVILFDNKCTWYVTFLLCKENHNKLTSKQIEIV